MKLVYQAFRASQLTRLHDNCKWGSGTLSRYLAWQERSAGTPVYYYYNYCYGYYDNCRYVNSFEAALFGPNFMDPVTGWRMYGNPTTFVDFFLTTEIIKNAKHTYHGTSFANKVRSQQCDQIVPLSHLCF